jgi:hypothetical protein
MERAIAEEVIPPALLIVKVKSAWLLNGTPP